jgi:hypothetical protein
MKSGKFKPKPSEFKTKLQNYGIPASHVAALLGYSYPHFLNILNGISPISPILAKKLETFFLEVELEDGEVVS